MLDNPTIQTILTSALTTLSTGAIQKANNPARAIDDLMTLMGFEKFHAWAERTRMKHATNLDDFKQKLADEITQIVLENIDNLKEPNLSIAGPALETAKFYLEENELRSMFSKLIASSMDKSKNEFCHPSFVEIIKQLDQVDAQNFNIMSNLYQEQGFIPTVKYFTAEIGVNKPIDHIIDHVFVNNLEQRNITLQSSSLTNLLRLGLIDIDYKKHVPDEYYHDLLHNSFVDEQNKKLALENKRILSHLGIIQLTLFGVRFSKACLSNIS